MYDKYFGLTDKPFSIAPDPRYLFMSEQHREALAHLIYGVGDGGGFVLLTGEVGTGKTTVCRCLLEQLPENTRIAFILNPKLTTTELLATVCDELHLEYPPQPSMKDLNDALNEFLLASHAAGLKIVLMIDEAQNLSIDTLEQIRLLTNLETNKEKLLQIILIGQPELKDLLARHELRQLAQRITARYHLKPLSMEESESYILHRLEVSGCSDTMLFDDKAIKELYKRTGGVPRLINVLCDRAMLGAYAKNRRQISANVIKRAASEIMGGAIHEAQADTIKPTHTPGYAWRIVSLVLSIVILAGGSYAYTLVQQPRSDVIEVAKPEPSEQTTKDALVISEQQAVIEKKTSEIEEIVEENELLKNSLKAIEDKKTNEAQLEAERLAQLVPLLPFLSTNIQSLEREQALTQLLGLWGLTAGTDIALQPCDYALINQLKCETEEGSWWQLNLLDRPAILTMESTKGELVYALLTSVEGLNIQLSFEGQNLLLTKQQVEEVWTGEITFLWQPPPEYETPLALSMKGVAVQWLLMSFAKLENIDLITPPDAIFDAELEQRVRNFQKQHSLQSDGVAGIYTLIALNSLTNLSVPLLLIRAEGS